MNSGLPFRVKENSLRARIAAKRLKEPKMAMVWGSTILLSGVTKEEFLNNKKWVKHEIEHIRQFKQHGFIPFMAKYIWESITKGYRQNRFEIAAREAENK